MRIQWQYLMTLRPPMPGAQPKGAEIVMEFDKRQQLVGYDGNLYRGWAVIGYDHALTDKEVSNYDLIFLCKVAV